MRALQRIINLELIFFSFGIAYCFTLLSNTKKLQKYTVLLFFASLLLLGLNNFVKKEGFYRVEKSVAKDPVDKLVEKMDHIPKGSLISYEPDTLPEGSIKYQLDAMLASQKLGLKCVNGYTATSAPGFDGYWHNLNAETRKSYFETMDFTPSDSVYVIH
jgi:hypothetical protein